MPILSSSRYNGRVLIHETATKSYTLQEFANASDEVVTNLCIQGISWSGSWTISRNSSTIVNLSESSQWKEISINLHANHDMTITGSGSIFLDCIKTTRMSEGSGFDSGFDSGFN